MNIVPKNLRGYEHDMCIFCEFGAFLAYIHNNLKQNL